MASTTANDRIRDVYRKAAPRYDRLCGVASRLMRFDEGRTWACGGAEGEVLEIGIGTGLNLPFYPAGANVTGIDLTAEMLAVARRRAAELGRVVGLHEGDATALPFADGSFDRVVCTLTLCTAPDPVAVVREAWRVCRGELRTFDHGAARSRGVQLAQRMLEPLTLRLDADHLMLDPETVFTAASVPVTEVARTWLGICWRVRALRG